MDTKNAYEHPIEVRFRDLDALGHVNHAVYLSYFEQSRMAWFRQLGLSRSDLQHVIPLILAKIEVEYLAPLLMHHQVVVTSSISAVGQKSFQIKHEVIENNGATHFVRANVVLVWFDYKLGKSILIPIHVREKLNQLMLAKG